MIASARSFDNYLPQTYNLVVILQSLDRTGTIVSRMLGFKHCFFILCLDPRLKKAFTFITYIKRRRLFDVPND